MFWKNGHNVQSPSNIEPLPKKNFGTTALCQPTECQLAECQPTECQFYNIQPNANRPNAN
jgi:hypothetical protein